MFLCPINILVYKTNHITMPIKSEMVKSQSEMKLQKKSVGKVDLLSPLHPKTYPKC